VFFVVIPVCPIDTGLHLSDQPSKWDGLTVISFDESVILSLELV